MKNLKRNRRSKEEGHMAALIRRKMIQRDHGDKSKYTRKEKHKGAWRSPSSIVYLQGKIKVMNKKISDFKVGDEFMVDGLAPNGEFVKTKCTLIEYRGMNQYVIDSDNCLVLADGNDNAYPIIDDMVYENEIDEWVDINEYKY